MPKTSTGPICPLCGERLSKDIVGRGRVHHLARPRGPAIFNNRDLIRGMLDSRDLSPNFRDYFNQTGWCPYQQGQQDP